MFCRMMYQDISCTYFMYVISSTEQCLNSRTLRDRKIQYSICIEAAKKIYNTLKIIVINKDKMSME